MSKVAEKKPQEKNENLENNPKDEVVQNIFQIAIDGPSASGKGTKARLLARRLGLLCLDTGALYRGITIHLMETGIDITDEGAVEKSLKEMKLTVNLAEGDTHIYLGKKDVTSRLHDVDTCSNVYTVAQLPKVREHVRRIQHDTAKDRPVIVEGRDITSVVFPDALFKFYITASLSERARRRYEQEVAKGNQKITLAHVQNMLYERDKADMERPESPLVKVKDAIVVDCTTKNPFEVVGMMEKIISRTLV